MYPPIDTRYDQGALLPVERLPRAFVGREVEPDRAHGAVAAFTLIELLVVVGIMVILMSLAIPAFTAFNGAGNFTKSASDIQSFLEQARSQAMARNTYVYVGIQEVDSLQAQAGTVAAGVGRIAIAAVASTNGIRPYTNTLAALTANIMPLGKVLYFDNVHLTNAPSLTSGTNMTGRPGGSVSSITPANITDLSTNTAPAVSPSFQWPLTGTPSYQFKNVIEFDPQGIPRIQTGTYSSSILNYIEIPLIPTHGNTAPATAPANQAAIQIDGVTGAIRLYRP